MARGKKEVDTLKVIKRLKILVFIFIVFFMLATLLISQIRDIPGSDALIITLEILAFEGPDAASFFERIVQLSLMVFGIFIVWFVMWSVSDIILDGYVIEHIRRLIKMRQVKNIKNHFIVYGGGRMGEHVADLLRQRHADVVIIDNNDDKIAYLKNKGYHVLSGELDEDSVLIEAGIRRAKGLIAALPTSEGNLMVTLAAKDLNPAIKVYVRINKMTLERKFKNAGADFVILPEYSAAETIVRDIGIA